MSFMTTKLQPNTELFTYFKQVQCKKISNDCIVQEIRAITRFKLVRVYRIFHELTVEIY